LLTIIGRAPAGRAIRSKSAATPQNLLCGLSAAIPHAGR